MRKDVYLPGTQKGRMARGKAGKEPESHRSARVTEAYSSGFFSATISGPVVMPTEWLATFSGEAASESLGDLQRFADRLMDRYNQVATLLHEDSQGFIDHTAALCATDESGAALLDWVRGFLDAIDLRDGEWKAFADDPRSKGLFSPLGAASDMASNPSKREWLRDKELRTNLSHALGLMTVRIWELWRQR